MPFSSKPMVAATEQPQPRLGPVYFFRARSSKRNPRTSAFKTLISAGFINFSIISILYIIYSSAIFCTGPWSSWASPCAHQIKPSGSMAVTGPAGLSSFRWKFSESKTFLSFCAISAHRAGRRCHVETSKSFSYHLFNSLYIYPFVHASLELLTRTIAPKPIDRKIAFSCKSCRTRFPREQSYAWSYKPKKLYHYQHQQYHVKPERVWERDLK